MTATATIKDLSVELTRSMRHPGRRTLALIDRALSYLTPFESANARAASAYERRELLELLTLHRMVLTPYIDVDRIERHLVAQTGVQGSLRGGF